MIAAEHTYTYTSATKTRGVNFVESYRCAKNWDALDVVVEFTHYAKDIRFELCGKDAKDLARTRFEEEEKKGNYGARTLMRLANDFPVVTFFTQGERCERMSLRIVAPRGTTVNVYRQVACDENGPSYEGLAYEEMKW